MFWVGLLVTNNTVADRNLIKGGGGICCGVCVPC
jgi:hypothetical protein